MEITNINFLNLDTLYQIVIDKFYDHNYNNVKFGRNLTQLLNHVVISLDLSSVSEYEYIYLKMYSTTITKLYNRRYNIDYINKNYPDVSDSLFKWLTILDTIDKDNDIKSDTMTGYFSPSGSIVGDCCISLSGSQIASIITLEPMDFFIKASDSKCVIANEDPSKNKLDPNYKDKIYTDESVKNFIISEFLTKFYKFLTEKATLIDLASDSFTNGKFLLCDNKKKVKLMNLRNPYVMCDFVEDDLKTIVENMKRYKESAMPKEFTINNTQFEILVCSEFCVFFELMNILPYEKFISLENLNIPASESLDINNAPKCPDEWERKYENRFYGRIKAFVSELNRSYDTHSNVIKRLAMTENYIPYSYSILLSLDDIDKYLNTYLSDKKDSTEYTDKLTISVINEIIKYTLTFYKSMV